MLIDMPLQKADLGPGKGSLLGANRLGLGPLQGFLRARGREPPPLALPGSAQELKRPCYMVSARRLLVLTISQGALGLRLLCHKKAAGSYHRGPVFACRRALEPGVGWNSPVRLGEPGCEDEAEREIGNIPQYLKDGDGLICGCGGKRSSKGLRWQRGDLGWRRESVAPGAWCSTAAGCQRG